MSLSSTESSFCYMEACEREKKKACGAIFIGIPTQRKPLWGERWHAKTSIKTVHCRMLYHVLPHSTAKQSVFLCIQVVSQTVEQKVWSEAKNREQNWGELQKKCFLFLSLWGLRTSHIRDSYAKLILRKKPSVSQSIASLIHPSFSCNEKFPHRKPHWP